MAAHRLVVELPLKRTHVAHRAEVFRTGLVSLVVRGFRAQLEALWERDDVDGIAAGEFSSFSNSFMFIPSDFFQQSILDNFS